MIHLLNRNFETSCKYIVYLIETGVVTVPIVHHISGSLMNVVDMDPNFAIYPLGSIFASTSDGLAAISVVKY